MLLPVGELTKARGPGPRRRRRACGRRPRPTARTSVSSSRPRAGAGSWATGWPCTAGEIVDADSGDVVGTVPAVELVTVGQRRGLGVAVDGRRLYALDGRRGARRVLVGRAESAAPERSAVCRPTWVDTAPRPSGPGSWRRRAPTAAPAPCTVARRRRGLRRAAGPGGARADGRPLRRGRHRRRGRLGHRRLEAGTLRRQ